jgi:hypothetical protein
VISALRIVQLGGHPQPVLFPSHAAFEDRAHIQLPCNRANILRLALKLERRGTRHHAQALYVGKDIRNLFGEAIAEILIVRACAQVHEWQDYE